jgi:hypothetical protein
LGVVVAVVVAVVVQCVRQLPLPCDMLPAKLWRNLPKYLEEYLDLATPTFHLLKLPILSEPEPVPLSSYALIVVAGGGGGVTVEGQFVVAHTAQTVHAKHLGHLVEELEHIQRDKLASVVFAIVLPRLLVYSLQNLLLESPFLTHRLRQSHLPLHRSCYCGKNLFFASGRFLIPKWIF